MDDQRARDEFERIKLHQDMERARHLIHQYEDGRAFYHRQIEDTMYKLGKLDERLGDSA